MGGDDSFCLMAVDNLPSEAAVEASHYFGDALLSLVSPLAWCQVGDQSLVTPPVLGTKPLSPKP